MPTKTMITPVMNHIYITPKDMSQTKGGIALPQRPSDEPGTRRGYVFAYSSLALRQMKEAMGDRFDVFGEGAEVEYYGHSTTRVDGLEFHVVKPVDIWAVLTEVEVDG